MIRIGIAGSGNMAKRRARSLAAIDGVTVAAACSRDINKAKAICDNAVTDFAAMLNQVDAVVITLPNTLHASHAQQALEAGKHTLVEYPLCTSVAQIDPLRHAAQQHDAVLMVGNTMIHEPLFQYLSQHRERLGLIVSAASRVGYYSPDLAGAWFFNPNYLGPVFAGLHYHHIEYYRRLIGDVRDVTAHNQSDRNTILGGVMTMTHASGTVSSIHWHLIAAPSGPAKVPLTVAINGTNEVLTVIERGGSCEVTWGRGESDSIENGDWGLSASTNDFLAAIAGELNHTQRLESDIATLQTALRASEASSRS